MKQPPTRPPQSDAPARLSVEALEPRDLPSGTPALLVQFRDGAAPDAALTRALPAGAAAEPTGVPGLYRLTGGPAALAHAEALFARDPTVRFAEPDYEVSVQLAPDDPAYQNGTLWGLRGANGIRAEGGWDFTTGATTVVIAGIDTGVDYTHPDLYLNAWLNQGEIPPQIRAALTDTDGDGRITFWDLNEPANRGPGKAQDLDGNGRIDGRDLLRPLSAGGWADGVSNDGDGYVDDLLGWDFRNNDNDPADDHGHGTHTAGTAAGVGDNGAGVAGVAWRAQVMALKFLGSDGRGSTSAAAAAVRYAADHGARVSNNSWGGGSFSLTMFDALAYADDRDHVFVAAAGNSGTNTDATPFYPAGYSSYNGRTLGNVLTVAATDANGNRASFSNYGAASVDVGAPGVGIYSTVRGGGYGYASGTSMAAPHAAGLAVLLVAQDPSRSDAEVIGQLISTVTPSAALADITVSGGIINAAEALADVPLSPPPGLPAPSGLVAQAVGPTGVALRWQDVSGESGYRVERSADGLSGWTLVSTTAADQPLLTEAGLQPGATYHYRVLAYGDAGNSAPSASAAAATPSGSSPLYASRFDAGAGPEWRFARGSWSAGEGGLRQTSTARQYVTKAVLFDRAYPEDSEVVARVRVDWWGGGDYPRVGVGLATDLGGFGYNLVFRSGGVVQFLDDGVRWGNAYPFAWEPGRWYWFRLRREGGALLGRVWADGQAEPSGWAYRQDGWTARRGGYPSLNGGSGEAKATFDDVEVREVLSPADRGLLKPAPSLGAPPAPGPDAVWVDTEAELQSAVRNLRSGQTVVIEPGTYRLSRPLVVGGSGQIDHVTIRGATDDFGDVVLLGPGMEVPPGSGGVPFGFTVYNAQDVLIANLSVGGVYYHAIDLQGIQGAERVRVYNTHLFDAGEQIVKSNAGGGGVDDSSLEYSLIEYTDGTPTTDHGGGLGYTGGLHAHEADRWVIRNNLFRNFHNPDGTQFDFNPVVLMWNYSADTVVEGNTFLDADRAVAFGLVDRPDGDDHRGGVIRNNFVYQTPGLFSPSRRFGSDAQILVYDSPGTRVYNNTVLTGGNSRLAVEVRWASTGVELKNNLADAPLGVRDGGAYAAAGNYLSATPEMLVNAENADLHLRDTPATRAAVIDRAAVVADLSGDWDGEPRPFGLALDVGADEWTVEV